MAFAQPRSSLGLGIDELTYFLANLPDEIVRSNELEIMDSIYFRALQITEGDVAEALLVATFTVIPYRQVPLSIPIINLTINYPLPTAEDSIHRLKNLKIPRRFLFDSPADNYGDSDKPAHFFGNASAAYRTRSNRIVLFFGRFVEVFEKNFNVESEISLRDQLVNVLGVNFGYSLLTKPKGKPSDYILGYNIYNLFFYL